MLTADQATSRLRYCALLKRQDRAAGHEVIASDRAPHSGPIGWLARLFS